VNATGGPGHMVLPPSNCCFAGSVVNAIRGNNVLLRIVIPWNSPTSQSFTLKTSRVAN
jgi:hypothetical protein